MVKITYLFRISHSDNISSIQFQFFSFGSTLHVNITKGQNWKIIHEQRRVGRVDEDPSGSEKKLIDGVLGHQIGDQDTQQKDHDPQEAGVAGFLDVFDSVESGFSEEAFIFRLGFV